MRDLLAMNVYICGGVALLCFSLILMNLFPHLTMVFTGVGFGSAIVSIGCALAYKISE